MQGAFDKLAEIRPTLAKGPQTVLHEDEFLQTADLVLVCRQTAENRRRLALAELAGIFHEERWQQALDLFYLKMKNAIDNGFVFSNPPTDEAFAVEFF